MTADQNAASNAGIEKAELKRKLALRLLSFVGLGIGGIGLLALLTSQSTGWTAAIGIGGMIFLASAAVGGGFGFLFAVPRVLAQDAPPPAVVTGQATGSSAIIASQSAGLVASQSAKLKARLLSTNTNLERISDWLTTMLVGVGLSQLGSIDGALLRFRQFLEQSARVMPAAKEGGLSTAGMLPTVGPMLLVFGLVMGFLFFYLYTRLVLVSLFNHVEDELYLGGASQNLEDLTAQGAVVAAAIKLQEENAENPALKGLVTSTQPSVDESLNVMFNTLYQPGKYQDVINLGGALSSTPATKRADYWFYMAAAFGQKYSALKGDGSADELRSARDNAIDCARRAVDIDASYRARLWGISNASGIDNDLADLRDDPAFLAITGMTGKASSV